MEHSTEKAAEWRLVSEIPGFEAFVGYRVSRDGRVETCWRKEPLSSRGGTRAVLTGQWQGLRTEWSTRYARVVLYVKGKRNRCMVHHLVMLAHGPSPRLQGLKVLHNDGNVKNNHVYNLRWGTQKENIHDKWLHGTMAWGERNGNSKLEDEEVLEIRRCKKFGESARSLASRFNVSLSLVKQIVNGTIWKHLLPSGQE